MKSLSDFFEELNECVERASAPLAQRLIHSVIRAKLPPHLKLSVNLAYLENGTYDQMVAHLNREFQIERVRNWWWITFSYDVNYNIDRKQTNSTTKRRTATNHLPILQKTRICHWRMPKKHSQRARTTKSKQTIERPKAKTFSFCPHCQRTKHRADKCWNVPNAANIPNR